MRNRRASLPRLPRPRAPRKSHGSRPDRAEVGSARAQQSDRFVAREQIEQPTQRFAARGLQLRIALEDQRGIVAGRGKSLPWTSSRAMRKPGMPLCRVPSTSPSPRSRRSSSAMRKPSSVSRKIASLALAIGPSGALYSNRQVERSAPGRCGRATGAAATGRSVRRARSPSRSPPAHRRRLRSRLSPPAARFALGEPLHGAILVGAAHPPMNQADPVAEPLFQCSCNVFPPRRDRWSRKPRRAGRPNRRAGHRRSRARPHRSPR